MTTHAETTTKIYACSFDELEDGENLRLDAAGGIALYRVDGEYFATSDSCTHEEWSLGEEGELEGHEILCTLHMARFDVRDGAPLCFPAMVGLKKFETVVEGDDVYVLVDKQS